MFRKYIAFVAMAAFILAVSEAEAQFFSLEGENRGWFLTAPVKKKPTVKNYEEALQQYSLWVKHCSEESFYKDVQMRDVRTKKVTKFLDMSPLQKDLFYLWQSEICANKMVYLYTQWQAEFKALPEVAPPLPDEEVKPKEEKKDPNREANQDDVLEYRKKLLELRKIHAVNFEKLIKASFKKHEKEIPIKDRESYSKRIHDWNLSQKLIEEK